MTSKEPRQLPPAPHIEHLRKEAKQRFTLLKQKATGTRLADAQYWLARDYGFSNWRALKEEVMRRMGVMRMVPAPGSRRKRFQPPPISADEEMEADFFFMRGAAVAGIGVIAALVIVAYVLLMIFSGHARGQPAPARPDTASHTVQMIPVGDGVTLEVLNFSGETATGRPLIFLAGLGSTAHDFDAFAPRFAATHPVFAITRRGFGASSRPEPTADNYEAERLGDDVLAVIDALKLDHPVLVGESLGGEELSSVASRHPEKIAGVIYLDAAYAFAYYAPGNLNPSNANLTMDLNALHRKIEALAPLWLRPKEGLTAVNALLDNDLPQLRADLVAARKAMAVLPDAPQPQLATPTGPLPLQARIGHAVQAGMEKYGALNVPVLAIFAEPHAPPPNPPSAAMLDYFKMVERIGNAGMVERYQAGNPSAHVVRIANAQHMIFRSNPDDVEHAMDQFLAKLN